MFFAVVQSSTRPRAASSKISKLMPDFKQPGILSKFCFVITTPLYSDKDRFSYPLYRYNQEQHDSNMARRQMSFGISKPRRHKRQSYRSAKSGHRCVA
jgi:hypothetical protein